MRNEIKAVTTILNNVGSVLLIFLPFTILPEILVLHEELNKPYHSLEAYIITFIVTLILGFTFKLLKAYKPTSAQYMLICFFSWLIVSLIGAIPYMIILKASFIDSLFETVSGFTTTGITVFTGLDNFPRSILLWRSITQWIGGLGILTFFLVVAYKGTGAHKLFGAESHKIDLGRPVPGLFNTVKILWTIYTIYTVLILILLKLAGMPLFDSLCHTMTALSTGGFSPHDASIEFYRINNYPHYILIEYIIILGMILGGINFLVHFRILKGNFKALFDNIEMKYFWILILIFLIIIFSERALKNNLSYNFKPNIDSLKKLEKEFRTILFQIVSILTTTGFGTKDINSAYFGSVAKILFLVMMLIGGCVGSTGGGFKIMRIAILSKLFKSELNRIWKPDKAINKIIIDNKILNEKEIHRTSALFFGWLILILFGGLVTALFSNYNALESLSGMFSALGNIGPFYIPVNEIGKLNPFIKLVYIFGMLAGRLEIYPVILIFSKKAWS